MTARYPRIHRCRRRLCAVSVSPFWAFTDPPPQPPRKALTAEETAKQDAFTAELNTLIVEQRAEQDALDAKYEAKFDKLFGLPALPGEAPVK